MSLICFDIRQYLHQIIASLLLITCEIVSADTYKIRGVANLPSDTIIDLAKTGKPTWHVIESIGTTLHQKLEEICGVQESEGYSFLESETLRLNRVDNLDTVIEKGVAIAIPFCLKIEKNVEINVEPGDSPEAILKRNYGVYGKKTIQKTYELNVPPNKQKTTSIQSFNKNLTPGDTLVIPYSSEEKILSERENSEKKVPEIIESIPNNQLRASQAQNTVSDENRPTSKPKQDYQYVRFLTAQEAQTTPDCILGPNETSSFIDDNLKNRFKIEFNLFQKELNNENEVPVSAIVGVIDTGLGSLGDDFFNEIFFKPNRNEKIGISEQDDDEPANGFVDDIYGVNFYSRNGDISFYDGDDEKDHGTQIASLILGGPKNALKFKQGNWSPIKLKIINYSKPSGGTIEPSSMADSIHYLGIQDAKIINMSLSNSLDLESIRNIISNNRNHILFIVAAGNKTPIDTTTKLALLPVYPARYGGEGGNYSNNVLTVGAYNLKGGLAQFSYYSNRYVDLLAPGCSIETRNTSGRIVLSNGTSVAAAITSFVAGLINSLGLENPQNVKNRLLISVDVDENKLSGVARTKGRLNPIKAISLRNDVLEKNEKNEYIFGRLIDINTLRKFCKDDSVRLNLNHIHKVIPNINTANGQEIEYWIDTDGNIEEPQRCPQIKADESIGEIIIEGKTEKTEGPLLSEIKDIVLAQYRN